MLFIYKKNVFNVWNDLKERFSQGDLFRIAELQQELHGLSQEHCCLWEEMELLKSMPHCTCPVS